MQELLSWRFLLLACIFIGAVAELVSVATKTATRLKEKREEAVTFRDGSEEEDDDLGPQMPDVPKTKAGLRKLQRDRRLYAAEIRAERARGLQWLALFTAITVWCTGILTRDNALSP